MNEKLRSVVAEVLGIPVGQVTESTSADTEDAWDSLRHMNIIFALEDAFGILFTDDEINRLVSVAQIEEIVAGKVRGNPEQ